MVHLERAKEIEQMPRSLFFRHGSGRRQVNSNNHRALGSMGQSDGALDLMDIPLK